MRRFLVIAIVIISSCSSKVMHYTVTPEIQAQEPVPLILGGRHYKGRVGDLVPIGTFGYEGFPDGPRECFLEDAASLLYVSFSIDPFDSSKMNSLENVELLTNIKRLRIYGKNMARVDFSPLSALGTLEELFIEGDISHPPDLITLEKLRWIKFEESALESLEGLGAPNVKKMELQMKSFDSLAPLSNLTELETLEIWALGSDFAAIGGITNVPNLKHLRLGYRGIIDLAGIERLTGLENLDLGSNATPVNTQDISRLHNLEFLSMSIIEDENPSIEYLKGLRNLRYINIYGRAWVLRLNGERKRPQQILDVSPLGESLNLEEIDLRGFIIKNVSALNHLENLMYNAIFLHESQLFDENEAKNSTKWLIFDVSILRDG